jgi:hypothetical protein
MVHEDTLRGTLLLRMATLETLAKQRRRHPLKAPCLHLISPRELAARALAKKVLRLSKNKRSGL